MGGRQDTFLRMFKQFLHNEGFPVVMFNAWETDFSEDPFIPLSTELTNGFHDCIKSLKAELEKLDSNDEEQEKIINNLKKNIDLLDSKTKDLGDKAKEVVKASDSWNHSYRNCRYLGYQSTY